LLETKRKLTGPRTNEMESVHLISTSPRMDDCFRGESFIDLFSLDFNVNSEASRATVSILENPRSLLVDKMVTAAEGIFTGGHGMGANKSLARNIVEKKTSLTRKLMDIWETIPKNVKETPVMTLFFAHGTEDQVGDSFYQAGAWGMPIEANRYRRDSKASLLAAQAKVAGDLGNEHQFRVRPWSAVEMLAQKYSVGANGMGGFRFMTEEQVNIWNGIYDTMVNIMTDLPKYPSEDARRELEK